MKRVVVTGMGVISPVGNDIDSFWNNLTAGKNGVGMITRFDAADQKVKVAGEVKDFDPLQYIEKSQVRKMDLFTQYAMAAAAQAMQDSGLKSGENIEAERLGGQSKETFMQKIRDFLSQFRNFGRLTNN